MSPSTESKFFIYGGLIFPAEVIPEIDFGVQKIREEAGYLPQDELKFNTRERPKNLKKEEVTKAKEKVLLICEDKGVLFIALLIHHKIIKEREREEQVGRAANHVIGRFNQFLSENSSYGICLVDRLPMKSGYEYLKQKFTKGLDMDSGYYIKLDRIKLFGSTCSNASHLSSVVDVVLGSFRYCVNNPENEVTKKIFKKVVSLMWGREFRGEKHVREKGLIIRPKDIKIKGYEEEYNGLLERLKACLEE